MYLIFSLNAFVLAAEERVFPKTDGKVLSKHCKLQRARFNTGKIGVETC